MRERSQIRPCGRDVQAIFRLNTREVNTLAAGRSSDYRTFASRGAEHDREKLVNFAEEAGRRPEIAAELPRFQAAVWSVFNPYEISGYLASLQPSARKKLQKLLYVN
jgi:hypothetical protein